MEDCEPSYFAGSREAVVLARLLRSPGGRAVAAVAAGLNLADLVLRKPDLPDQQPPLDHDSLSTVFPRNTLTPGCMGLPEDLLNDTICPVW